MADTTPLVLDVDGTFLRTDLLLESFWAGLGHDPFATLKAVRLVGDRAALKAELACISPLRMDLMPVSDEVMALVEAAKAEGREVCLASASDITYVRALAQAHGLSERVFASQGGVNLKGSAKAAALVEAFGEGGFDYAGNEGADRAIWRKARRVITLGEPRAAREMRAAGHEVTELSGGFGLKDLIRGLRPHQWVKNVLLFLPLIAAHAFDLMSFAYVLLGIAGFSLAASSIYVVNDLLDLEADRLHATKCKRPFASGAVPIPVGMAAGLGAGALALILAATLGWAFFAVIVGYMVLSLSYSLKLKRMRWIDIAVLASLYTIRVVAGAFAAKVVVSVYLLGFIFPAFIALGCVKRLTEVTLAKTDERLPGRAYAKPDRGDILNIAVLGVVFALLAFFLYSFTPQARLLYPDRWLVWVALAPIAWWLIRMVRLGYHGKQDHDPIVFAMKDKRGIGIMLIAVSLMFQGAGLWSQWVTHFFG